MRDSHRRDPAADARASGAWVRNASSLPVYDLTTEWLLDDVLFRDCTLRTVPPGDEPVFVEPPSRSEYLRVLDVADSSPQESLAARVEVLNRDLDVRITVTEAAGRTWRRSQSGVLAEMNGALQRTRAALSRPTAARNERRLHHGR